MGRNNMGTVVNQAQQPTASQYGHMQIMTSHPMHQVAPIIVNPGLAAPLVRTKNFLYV